MSFSGELARNRQHDVIFVTERAVFRLVEQGLELVEIAPGIDLESQVLAQLDFRPVIREVRPMAAHLFT